MVHLYRFLTLISAILACLTLTWFGLRTYGLSRDLMEHQTPLVKILSRIKGIEWTQYRPNQSTRFFHIETYFEGGQWIAQSQDKTWPLEQLLNNESDSYFIMNVQLTKTEHTAKLKSLIDKGKHWERIIFFAPVENTLTTLRELSPQWTFANGPMFLIRFLTLANLKLESLMDIKSDVLYISTKANGHNKNLNMLIDEATRQKKYIIIGPVPKPWDEISNIGWFIDSTE